MISYLALYKKGEICISINYICKYFLMFPQFSCIFFPLQRTDTFSFLKKNVLPSSVKKPGGKNRAKKNWAKKESDQKKGEKNVRSKKRSQKKGKKKKIVRPKKYRAKKQKK